MANKQYQKGVRLEREIVNAFKKEGWFAARTAGSHSPADVVAWSVDKSQARKSAEEILQGLKFSTTVGGRGMRKRTSQKYTDTLYDVSIYDDQHDWEAYFIQAKRKAVKHG